MIEDRQVTCFASDPEMMGRQAVRLLAERMQGQRQQVARLVLSSRLVQGTTTGPAAAPGVTPKSAGCLAARLAHDEQ